MPTSKGLVPSFITLFVVMALIMAALAYMPFFFGWAYDGNNFKFDAYGTWLQGSLTPVAVIAAILGVALQAVAQSDSNKLNALNLFATTTQAISSHINYKAASAIRGDRPNAAIVAADGYMHAVRELLADPTKAGDNEMRAELINDLQSIVGMARNQGALFLLDHRILQLHDLLVMRHR